MLKNVYEGFNAPSEVYLSKEYFCKMYPTCVSSKLCEFFFLVGHPFVNGQKSQMTSQFPGHYESIPPFGFPSHKKDF